MQCSGNCWIAILLCPSRFLALFCSLTLGMSIIISELTFFKKSPIFGFFWEGLSLFRSFFFRERLEREILFRTNTRKCVHLCGCEAILNPLISGENTSWRQQIVLIEKEDCHPSHHHCLKADPCRLCSLWSLSVANSPTIYNFTMHLFHHVVWLKYELGLL